MIYIVVLVVVVIVLMKVGGYVNVFILVWEVFVLKGGVIGFIL